MASRWCQSAAPSRRGALRIISVSAAVAVVAASAGAVSAAGAQSIRLADSLFQSGSLARAESVYYAAVRARPRDPIARWSLGRFLVARGAPRIGATLFEEALRFGGQAAVIEPDLAATYLATGEYRALAALSTSTPPERARAEWLAARDPRIVAPDSVLVALFQVAADTSSIGRMPIRVNGIVLDGAVSARVKGIVISDSSVAAQRVRKFVDAGAPVTARVLAAADSVGIGRLSMHDVPVAVLQLDGPAAMIGLDMLGRFAPTFDPKAGRITLRVSGTAPGNLAGTHLSTWNATSDFRVLQAGGWLSLTQSQVARLLREHPWTLDAKRGQLIVEP